VVYIPVGNEPHRLLAFVRHKPVTTMPPLLTCELVRIVVFLWCVYVVTMLVMIAVEDSQVGKVGSRGKNWFQLEHIISRWKK
jgi:hypothetical protein